MQTITVNGREYDLDALYEHIRYKRRYWVHIAHSFTSDDFTRPDSFTKCVIVLTDPPKGESPLLAGQSLIQVHFMHNETSLSSLAAVRYVSMADLAPFEIGEKRGVYGEPFNGGDIPNASVGSSMRPQGGWSDLSGGGVIRPEAERIRRSGGLVIPPDSAPKIRKTGNRLPSMGDDHVQSGGVSGTSEETIELPADVPGEVVLETTIDMTEIVRALQSAITQQAGTITEITDLIRDVVKLAIERKE